VPQAAISAEVQGIMTSPKIIFYTHSHCPWAHRVHIVLKELEVPYEEVPVDLHVLKEPWYLKLNPV
jgi:glutathione S-transferase